MALGVSSITTSEAALGIFLVGTATFIAMRWATRVGKGHGWDEDRITRISNRIALATFLVTFLIAYVAQDQIADLLEHLAVLLK